MAKFTYTAELTVAVNSLTSGEFTSEEEYDTILSLYAFEERSMVIFYEGGTDQENSIGEHVRFTREAIEAWYSNDIDLMTSIEIHQLKYLVDDLGYPLEEAVDKMYEVDIFEGTRVEYAEEETRICNTIPEYLEGFIDFDKMANDWEQGGDLTEVSPNVWVTNSNSI